MNILSVKQMKEINANVNEAIFFYGGYFSQFYPTKFQDEEGVVYQTTEQFMMAKKSLLFNDLDTYPLIMATYNPMECKILGRHVKGFDDRIWKKHMEEIVFKGNMLKFTQNSELLTFMLSTRNRYLVESSPSDLRWGIGLSETDKRRFDVRNWRGENLLGIALMKVRNKIQEG